MERYAALSPAGAEAVEPKPIAPRLTSFEGKTIGEFWNGVYKGDLTFPVLREYLMERFPGLKIVPYTEFPFHHGGDNPSHQMEMARRTAALAKEKGCDAVISGNGA